jgi:succinate dehydrogenase flavin-adding protein (antitoxin of CptAB toxin-antitoxin module)
MVAAVPQIEGLTVKDMPELAKTSLNAFRHLFDQRDWDCFNCKWLTDILYTVKHAMLEKIINDAVKARKERLERRTTCWWRYDPSSPWPSRTA